jgi:hypothetical protein
MISSQAGWPAVVQPGSARLPVGEMQMRRMRLVRLAVLAGGLAGCSAAPPVDMPQAVAPGASARTLEAGRPGASPGAATPGGFGIGGWGGSQAPTGMAPAEVTRAPRP